MRHSWTIAVLLAVAPLAGYAVGTRPVQAQAEAFPFAVGETVTFSLHPDGSWKCRIEEIRGTFARCIDASMPQVVRYGGAAQDQQWV